MLVDGGQTPAATVRNNYPPAFLLIRDYSQRRAGVAASIRMNRNTLYSAVIVDLDAGPATVTLPEAGKRFMLMQIVNEDQYSLPAIYRPGKHVLTKEKVGTRHVIVGVRTLVDPNDPADLGKVHRLQDGLKIEQKNPGKFDTPKWDSVSQKKVRDALIVLGTTLTDTSRAFGTKDQVDPVQRLISAATTWGGNPRKDAWSAPLL